MDASDILAIAAITLVIITIIFQISFFIIQNLHARAAATNDAQLAKEMRSLLAQIGRIATGRERRGIQTNGSAGTYSRARHGADRVPLEPEILQELRDIRVRISSLERSLAGSSMTEEAEETLDNLDDDL